MTVNQLRLKLILTTLLSVLLFTSQAQFDKELWDWESHLPVQNGYQVAQSKDHIYYATLWSIVRVEKEEQSGSFLSKVSGLTDTGISTIAYDDANEQLIIAYTNGGLDYVQKDGSVINIADFQQNVTFPDKTINKIIVTDNGRALFATRFGVVAQNLETYFFDFTTNMETEVLELAQKSNKIYAATEEGIYLLDEKENVIPDDFTAWTFLDGAVGLPAIYSCIDIEIYEDEVYAIIDDQLYRSTDGNWSVLQEDSEEDDFIFISAEGQHLLVGSKGGSKTRLDAYDKSGNYIPSENSCANSMVDAIETQNGAIWYADRWHGFRNQEGLNEDCSILYYDSPYSQRVREIRVKDSDPYISSGGINENFLFDDNRNGFYIERDGDWKNYNGNSVSEINANSMINFVVVQPHPSKDIIYAGAFPGGLLEINNETGVNEVYNKSNSPLMGTANALDLVRVVELQFDDQENLWVVTYNAEEPLHVMTPQGVWHSFSFGNIRNLGAMQIDDFGKLWFQLATGNGGVLVFDHGGTIADPTDDDYVKFNSSNTEMTTNRVLSIKKDLDGDMWVGTLNGPVIFECGDIFPEKNCSGSIRKVLQDSIPAPLLATEAITTIAVDGANRKWLGSGTGIYVQSASGNNEELRLTVDNSPLFDNNIIDIEYDPVLGEMYIGTIKGVQSVRIDATGATQFFSKSNMYTFPNPVRPDWTGLIAISGLARDANVKITDMQGRLVFEANAKGGLLTWDGFDYTGRRAKAGVYMVYATYTKDLDNIATETTKFVIME